MQNKISDVSPLEESSDQDQVETFDVNQESVKASSYQSRKAAQSKREIMEELSRERFPWEE
jgi:6-phosphogluconate dehydrogenase (decarboxylating)